MLRLKLRGVVTRLDGLTRTEGGFVNLEPSFSLTQYRASLWNIRSRNRKIYISFLDVLLCSIAECFYELCRIFASPRASQNTNNE